MDSASETTPNKKRAKTGMATDEQPGILPKDAALLAVNVHFATLPLCIKPSVEKLFQTFFSLKVELAKRQSKQLKLETDQTTPASARINFKLGPSDKVKEKFPDEIEHLVALNEQSIKAAEKAFRENIDRLLDFEIKQIKAEISEHYVTSVASIIMAVTKCYEGGDPPALQNHCIDLICAIYDYHGTVLLKNSEIADVETFYGKLREEKTIQFPEDYELKSRLTEEKRTALEPTVYRIGGLLNAMFVAAWNKYRSRKEEMRREIDAANFLDSRSEEKATNDTAMEIEQLTTNSTAVKDLIKGEVATITKPIVSQHKQLVNQLNQLKGKRGAHPGAQNTKKTGNGSNKGTGKGSNNKNANKTASKTPNKSPKGQAKSPKGKAAAQKAAAADKGSKKDKKSSSGGNKQNKTKDNTNKRRGQRN